MKIESKNYQVVECSLSDRSDWEEWRRTIADALGKLISNECTLFTIGINFTNSIGYDLGNVTTGKFNSVKYLTCVISKLTAENALALIEDAEFYLGHTILVNGTANNDDIQNLVILWEGDIARSGVEFFKMDNDGYYFSWYNPKNSKNAQQLLEDYLSA